MQFSLITIIAALAATTTAITLPSFNATTTAYYPTGTGAGKATGTGHLPSTTNSALPTPWTGAANDFKAGSAMAIIVAGGAALMF